MARRTRERLEALGRWVHENCCKGRSMKVPVLRGKDYDVEYGEPKCFLGNYYPLMVSSAKEPYKIAPSILIMTGGGLAAGETEEYLDSRQGISRPKEVGATLNVQLIHVLYDPGERTGKRTDDGKAFPHEAIRWDDEKDEGSLQLMDWMDDTQAALLGADSIPGCDLIVKRGTVGWEPLKENGAVADRRPLYLGFVSVTFEAPTHEEDNDIINDLLT